jgi:dihydrodipicolinate synthase/N-acetylneuraminate lyase
VNNVEYQLVLLRFAGRLAVIDNQLLPVFNQLMGGSGVNLHPALFWPEWGVKVWGLLEVHRWDEAQAKINRLLLPHYELGGETGAYTGGEGQIGKAGLELVGLPGGHNRPPTRPLPPVFKERSRRLCLEVGMPMDRF